jgi:hypothetical protein
MSMLKALGAAAVLSAISFMPARTQEVVWEPGYCAQFYPYANCQNAGAGNPLTDPNYPRGPQGSHAWVGSSGETVGVAPRLSASRRSARTTYANFEVWPHPRHMRDLPERRGRPVYDQVKVTKIGP